ncbi:MAG: mechanosensitive ion channel family protein [Candidatus Eiseniibacteriota bacterium]
MLSLVILQANPWPGALDRLGQLGSSVEGGAISAGIALLVMFAGWVVAAMLSRLVRVVLRGLKFDQGVGRVIGARAVSRHEPASLAAWAVYWLVLSGAAVLALDTLGLHIGTAVAERLRAVVPGIVTSAVLFAVGSLIAMFGGAVTRRFLESAEIRAARFQGQVVTAVLTGFAALVALEQLGFAAQFVIALGIVATSAAGLALALAFGLGCRDLARDFLVEYLRSLDDENVSRPE